jgi:hypothetical protein
MMELSLGPITEWTFPFRTCETVISTSLSSSSAPTIVAQPWSFAINLVSVISLSVQCVKSKDLAAKMTILSFIVFELFHTISHAHHFSGTWQTHLIHFLAYAFCFTTYQMMKHFTKAKLSASQTAQIGTMIAFDLALLLGGGGLWTVLSGLSIFLRLFLCYWNHLPTFFQIRLKYHLFPGLFLLFALFVNEAFNCKSMLQYFKLPYHAIIEVVGFLLFWGLADSVVEWDAHLRSTKQ